MTAYKELTARQSSVIDAMRFLLIVLVLFVHMLPPAPQPVQLGFTGKNVYIFFTEMISHNLGAMAVPAFFIFSGYFFFLPLKDNLTFSWLQERWKKRIHTLLIPYLFWNLLFIIIICIKNGAFSFIGLDIGEEFETVRRLDIFNWIWTGPVDFPLWYLRDLICMTVLAPVFFFLCKYLKAGAPLILIIFYLSGLSIPITGMGSTAITFFGLGAFFGINRINIIEFCTQIKWPSIIIASIGLLLATIFNGNSIYGILERSFIIFAIIACVNLTDALSDKSILNLASLSGTVFFIYAAHEIFILGWTKGLCLRIFGDGLAGSWISYFLVPVIVLAVCLLFYNIINRIMPRTLAFACGGRSKKK